MITTYSSTELRVTALWSTAPEEDEVVIIDHDDTDHRGIPNFNRALISDWEQLTKEATEEGTVAVGALYSGKAFEVEPLLDIVRLSRVEAKEGLKEDGTE